MPRVDVSTLSPVDKLALVRLVVGPAKTMKADALTKALAPFLADRWTGSAAADVVDRSLIKLGTLGLVAQTPAKSRKAAPTFSPTTEGHAAAPAILRVDALPTKPKPTWASVQKALLPSLALDLPASEPALSKDDGLRAVLLDRQAGLRLGAASKLKDVKMAWLRWRLGVGPKEKLSVETIIDILMSRELGAEAPARPKAALDLLLARGLGAPGASVKSFRERLIAQWVAGGTGGQPTASAATFETLEPAAFARRVREAVRRSKTGRYGGNKVFIVHAWRALGDDPAFRGGDFDAFKKRLTEANNARLLSLSRADLVQAMDPEDVRLSETPYMNTCFHFIRDDLEPEGAP